MPDAPASARAAADKNPAEAGRHAEPHVLVVAPNWLGDAVMSLPALADIRRAYPMGLMSVAARSSVAPLYGMVPGVDQTIVTRWRGSLSNRDTLDEDAQRVRDAQVDIAILFPNSFASAWAMRRARVEHRWGYSADLRRPLLTRSVGRPRASVHQGAYYQHLVRGLGMATGDLEPVVTVPPAAIEDARALLAARGRHWSRPLLVVAPGAAYGMAKRWLPRHFATMISATIDATRAECAIVGTADDAGTARDVLASVAAAHRESVIDLTGATTLPVLGGVMTLAAACVSNDSGAMHLAGAVGTPLAALFGPTRDHETAPLTRRGRRAEVLFNPVWCRPCMLRECPIDHGCMRGLEPARVFATVRELMEHRS
jgi:heptosyltransferase-2